MPFTSTHTWKGVRTNYKVVYGKDGEYTGDFFSYTDYNGYFGENLKYLADAVNYVYGTSVSANSIPVVTVNSWTTVNHFNTVEQAIQDIAKAATIPNKVQPRKTWKAGDRAPSFLDINRMNEDILTIYTYLSPFLG